MPDAVAQLQQAASQAAYDTLAAIGHTLKGCGGTLGFPAVSEIAERLEIASFHRHHDAIYNALGELEAFIDGQSIFDKK